MEGPPAEALGVAAAAGAESAVAVAEPAAVAVAEPAVAADQPQTDDSEVLAIEPASEPDSAPDAAIEPPAPADNLEPTADS
jgi:hypothetical protein